MENLKSEQVLNIIGHHYFKNNSNDRYLFGDNINRVRNAVGGVGGSGSAFNMDSMLTTQSGTKQGIGRGTIDRFKNNSNDVRNYNPNQQQQTQENPTDQITHTVSSLAELESITQGQFMNVQLTPAAYAALAQGKQVKLTLQKMPPQRVNMLLPLLTTAMAAFGGANGAAYNDALFNAINPQLKKAEDFIQKNGTKYSLNPFGGAQADNIKASIEILETDAPKRDTGSKDTPTTTRPKPPVEGEEPEKPGDVDVTLREVEEKRKASIRDVSAHDSGKVGMIKKTTTGGIQTQPTTPIPPPPVAEGVTVPKVDAKKVQTPNLEGKVIGKFQGFFDNSIYSTTSKLTFTKPLEPQSHFDTKEQALFAAQSASSGKGQAFVVVKNSEGGFDVHGVKATLPETFTQKSTQEQIQKAEQVTGYSVADINTDGAEISVDSIVTADAQVFSSPEVHGNKFSGNHFNKQQVPQEYAPVNLKLAELDRMLGDKDIKVTSFQGKFDSQDKAEAMAAKLAEGGKQDAVVLKSGNQFFVYTTTEIMDSGDKGKIHDFNPDATKGFEVVSFAKSDPNKSNAVSLLRKTEDGVFSTEAKLDPKIQATPYNPSAKKDSNTLIGEATTLQSKISDLNTRIAGKTLSPDELTQAKAELTTLKAQLTTLTDEVNSLDSGNANVRKLKDQVKGLSDTVGKLETNLNKFGDDLTVHTQKVEEAKKAPTPPTTDETMTFDTNFFTSSTGFREQAQTYIDNKDKIGSSVQQLKDGIKAGKTPQQLGFKDKASLDSFVGRMDALLTKIPEGSEKLGEFLKSGNGPNRNDIAHLVIRPNLDTSTPNANGNSGITKEGNNGIFFSTTRDVETSYVSKLIGSGSISQEEYRRGLVVLALSDAFGGDHNKVGDLLDPNKTPDLKQAIKDLGIKLTPKQEELVDLGIPKAGQPKSKVDAEINKLVAHIRDTQSNSFIETRTKTEPFSGKTSDYNIKAMGAEMVLRHKKGSEGEPVHQVMDGLVGAQHITCLQETFVLRAQSLTDVAQMANGQAPLNRTANADDWSKLSTELGIPVDKLKDMVKAEGSIDNPDKARLDTIITSLRNSTGIDQEKLQKAFSSISSSEFESMDVSNLTSSQKQAFIDSGIKPEQLQSGKVSALFTGENRSQILGKVQENLGTLKKSIISETKGLDLSLHPELAQLAKEIDTISSDIAVAKTNGTTVVTSTDEKGLQLKAAAAAANAIKNKGGSTEQLEALKGLVARYNEANPDNKIDPDKLTSLTSDQSIKLLEHLKSEVGKVDDPRSKDLIGDDKKGLNASIKYFTTKNQKETKFAGESEKYQDDTIITLKNIKAAAASGSKTIVLQDKEISLPQALREIKKDYTKFAIEGNKLNPEKAKEITALLSELDIKLETNVSAEVRDILTLNDRANGIVDGALEKAIAGNGRKPLEMGDKEGLVMSALRSLPEGELKGFVANALSDHNVSEDELNTLLTANYEGFDNEKVAVLVQAVVDKYKSELPKDSPQKNIKINILSDMNKGKPLSDSLSAVQNELFPSGTKNERVIEETGKKVKQFGTMTANIPFIGEAGTMAKAAGEGMENIRSHRRTFRANSDTGTHVATQSVKPTQGGLTNTARANNDATSEIHTDAVSTVKTEPQKVAPVVVTPQTVDATQPLATPPKVEVPQIKLSDNVSIPELTVDSPFAVSFGADAAAISKINNILRTNPDVQKKIADSPALTELLKTGSIEKLTRAQVKDLVRVFPELKSSSDSLLKALDDKEKATKDLTTRLQRFNDNYTERSGQITSLKAKLESPDFNKDGKDFSSDEKSMLKEIFGDKYKDMSKEDLIKGLNVAQADLDMLKAQSDILTDPKNSTMSKDMAFYLIGNINSILEGKGTGDGHGKNKAQSMSDRIHTAKDQITSYVKLNEDLMKIAAEPPNNNQRQRIIDRVRQFRGHETNAGADRFASRLLNEFRRNTAQIQNERGRGNGVRASGVSGHGEGDLGFKAAAQSIIAKQTAETQQIAQRLTVTFTNAEAAHRTAEKSGVVLSPESKAKTSSLFKDVAISSARLSIAESKLSDETFKFKDSLKNSMNSDKFFDNALARGLDNYEVEIPDTVNEPGMQALEDVVTEQEQRANEAEFALQDLESNFDSSEANTSELLQKFRDIIVELDIKTRESNKGGNKGSVDTKYLDKLREIQKRWDALDKSKLEEKLATEKLKEGSQKLNLAKLKADIGGSFNNIFSVSDTQNK